MPPDAWFPPLLPGVSRERVGPHITSVLPAEDRGSDYDRIAALYDAVIGNGLYNRVMWGVRKRDYHRMAIEALCGARGGRECVLDCGCGSLVFTAAAYREAAPDRTILFDRSLAMLTRAVRRVALPAVQGDALAMPFADGCFDRVMAWGLPHLFGSHSPLFAEMARVAKPAARIDASIIVLAGRRIGDGMLHRLVRHGEAAAAETASAYAEAFSSCFAQVRQRLVGNMLFLSGTRPD